MFVAQFILKTLPSFCLHTRPHWNYAYSLTPSKHWENQSDWRTHDNPAAQHVIPDQVCPPHWSNNDLQFFDAHAWCTSVATTVATTSRCMVINSWLFLHEHSYIDCMLYSLLMQEHYTARLPFQGDILKNQQFDRWSFLLQHALGYSFKKYTDLPKMLLAAP